MKPNRPNTELESKTFAKLPGFSIVGRSVTQTPDLPIFEQTARQAAEEVFRTNAPSLIKGPQGDKGDKGDKGDTGLLDEDMLTYILESIERINLIISGLTISSNCNNGNLTVALDVPTIDEPRMPKRQR